MTDEAKEEENDTTAATVLGVSVLLVAAVAIFATGIRVGTTGSQARCVEHCECPSQEVAP